MPTKLKPFAAPATSATSAMSAASAPLHDADLPPDRNARLRNRCAIAVAACYILVNLIGYVTLHHVTMFASDHALEIIGGISLLGIAMAGFYIAFCCYGAKARGWSGWMGAPVALLGVAIWFGVAFALLFQNINTGVSAANAPSVGDDRVRWLVVIAFVVSALALWALPKRTQPGRVSTRQGA